MAGTKIDEIMDAVRWTECEDTSEKGDEGVPFATHHGVLRFGRFTLRVYTLSNGQRLIDAEDVHRMLDWQAMYLATHDADNGNRCVVSV